MLFARFFLCCIGSVSASFLTCTPSNLICPDSSSVISCDCQAATALRWTVTSLTGNNPEQLLSLTYSSGDNVGPASSRSMNGYTVVLCDVNSNILTSTLNFAFTEDVNVVCIESSGNVSTATIQAAGRPSPPVNLQYTLNITATDSITVRLDWDPPLDDGGVAITNYQISVNMSEPVITTEATFTLNSTGEHLVQVRAVNCAGVSDDASVNITIPAVGDTTQLQMAITTELEGTSSTSTEESASTSNSVDTSTSTSSATSSNTTQAAQLSMEVIIGIVAGGAAIAFLVVVICCVIVVLIVRARARNFKPKELNGEQEDNVEYSRFNFNRGDHQPPAGNGIQLDLVLESEYSQLDHQNGAKPEIIDNYDYCTVPKTKTKEKKEKQEQSLEYAEVISTTRRISPKKKSTPSSLNVLYSHVKVKTRPEDELLTLDSLLLQLRSVQSKWEEIAKALNISHDRIKHIKQTTSGEDYEYLVEVCDEWLRQLRDRSMTPTWKAVSKALDRMGGCHDLAKEIKAIYDTGKLPYSGDTSTMGAVGGGAIGVSPGTGDGTLGAESNYDDVLVNPTTRNPPPLPDYDDVVVATNEYSAPPIPPKMF